MIDFDPADNTAVCVYGPPEYFESLSEQDEQAEGKEEDSFFAQILALIRKLIDFIKHLFVR